ncbi:hypothetical protein ESZ36_00325 [Colwellia demingiae]|uniref:Uncharacterized protein n=2 Tax=Colwellia TaxID=28228 RepID=A0A5C6QSA7_9GAMM|nr:MULTISPECIES: hypothetical protein [Colwellia]TWX71717.1 hypothetical protein ESZ36_00325 [Colwellia demingiae]TYK66828.1 hypothetical protein CWS31_003330 [Colwellia echini]
MAKDDWTNKALLSLQFFRDNPEYKSEFGHKYFMDNLDLGRATLNRNKTYLKEFQEVKKFLKNYKSTNPIYGPAKTTGEKTQLETQAEKIKRLELEKSELQLRLNDCYQMLEDHGIDPQFIYPNKLMKHRQA